MRGGVAAALTRKSPAYPVPTKTHENRTLAKKRFASERMCLALEASFLIVAFLAAMERR